MNVNTLKNADDGQTVIGSSRRHLHIERGIHIVNILLIQFFPEQLHGFSETLEMHDFPLPQELDHIIDIGIIRQSENVIVGDPSFLFWGVIINTTKKFRKFGNKRLSLTDFYCLPLNKYNKNSVDKLLQQITQRI